MQSLNAAQVREKIMEALGLPPEARVAKLNGMADELKASKLGKAFEADRAAGRTTEPKSIDELVAEGMALHQDLESGAAVRVRMRVRKVRCAVALCDCGREMMSPSEDMVKSVERGSVFPPVQCSCGRVLLPFSSNLA